MRVLGICGSLQARSGNLALLHAAAASMPRGVELVLRALQRLIARGMTVHAPRVGKQFADLAEHRPRSCGLVADGFEL